MILASLARRTERSTLKMEDTLKNKKYVSPSLFRRWRWKAPSAYPNDPESDVFQTCAARDDAWVHARIVSLVFVRWVLDRMRRHSDFEEHLKNHIPFPDWEP